VQYGLHQIKLRRLRVNPFLASFPYPAEKCQKNHCVACVWLAVVLMHCCNGQQVCSRQVRVCQVSGKLLHFRITVPLEHCGAVQYVPLPPQGCELVMPQRCPDIARFRVGTGNPREKDARRKGRRQKEKENDSEGRSRRGALPHQKCWLRLWTADIVIALIKRVTFLLDYSVV